MYHKALFFSKENLLHCVGNWYLATVKAAILAICFLFLTNSDCGNFKCVTLQLKKTIDYQKMIQILSTQDVGTWGAQGHMPPQYFKKQVPVPLQHFQQTLGPTKCVSLQYLTPSYAPGTTFSANFVLILSVSLDIFSILKADLKI